MFTRNYIQSHKSVPETKIEKQQTTINKQDVNVDDHFESASDDLILPLSSNLVKDTALQLLETYMRDHGSYSNWDDFNQILRNTFLSDDLDYRNRVLWDI